MPKEKILLLSKQLELILDDDLEKDIYLPAKIIYGDTGKNSHVFFLKL
jgi:hypothetical protein